MKTSDLSTTYLGRVDTTRVSKIKVEERIPISEQGSMIGKLLDVTECQILLDTGVRRSFMSRSHYLHCKSWHSLPKFMSKIGRIQVGNGQFINVLFIIPKIIDIPGHRFDILYQRYIKCRFGNWHKKYIWIRRNYKFMRVMLYFQKVSKTKVFVFY